MGKSTSFVQAVDRALAILEALAESERPMGLVELSTRVGLHVSTVHRLLSTMSRRRFVTQDPESGRYRLGMRAFEVGSAAIQQVELREVARPYLRWLMEETQETANLAVLIDGEVVYIDQVESQNLVRMFTRVGRRVPAHCTGVGKILLAGLSDDEVQRILDERGLPRFTPHTIVDPRKLLHELERVRASGFALDNEEREVGVRCVAGPVRDHEGRVVAAVSISGPSSRITEDRIPHLIQAVRTATSRISMELGWHEKVAPNLQVRPPANVT
ncbi:MAG: IclR family transcriptional regulator [Armatimonadota bacterium]|nr:IclR family transcriptional regulator [Armatimonadota bacterium]MDR5703229.1 IclR family transcriptional regulator [Armatimonadota bacterium]